MFTLRHTSRKIFIFTYVVEDTFLSNTPFEFCGALSSFLRYAILKFHTFVSSFRYILFMCLHFLFTFAQHGFILYFPCVFIFFCLRLLVVTSMSLSYRNIRNVCVHTHTHTRARGGCKGGFRPPLPQPPRR